MFGNEAQVMMRVLAFGILSLSEIGLLPGAPLRIGSDEGRRAVLSKVAPAPPPLARQAHISGRVLVDLIAP